VNLLQTLPVSLLNGLLFCPRRTALKVVEGWLLLGKSVTNWIYAIAELHTMISAQVSTIDPHLHLESICVFGPSTISPPALDLCWEHGVAVNFLSEW